MHYNPQFDSEDWCEIYQTWRLLGAKSTAVPKYKYEIWNGSELSIHKVKCSHPYDVEKIIIDWWKSKQGR